MSKSRDVADIGESGDYATAAQGSKADSALQDGSLYATAAQGSKASSALQPDGDGSGLSGISGVAESIAAYATAPSVGAEGSVYYDTASSALFVSNGSVWEEVSPKAPVTTGGTVTLAELTFGLASFSYALGTDFNDYSTSDADLVYTLTSGTLPSGVTISGVNLVWDGVSPEDGSTYTFSITATDEDGLFAAQGYSQVQENVPTNTVTGSQLFSDSSGTSGTWTVPADVYNISVVAVGAGASGDRYDNGGGGGALGYKNDIPCSPGQTFTYASAAAKAGAGSGSGAASTFSGTGVNLVAGGGTWSSKSNTYGVHAGGTHSGSDGGGDGGSGGYGNNHAFGPSYSVGGGGGAGGYSGNGGNGGNGSTNNATAGLSGSGGGGGGGGGGYDNATGGFVYAREGGGVGVLGQGSNGAGGNASGDGTSTGGNPNPGPGTDGSGGSYGSGGAFDWGNIGPGGAQGAVRIVWHVGSTQAFPSTDVN
jgi:hypothetical protein